MELIFADDPHQMDWVRSDYPYAEVVRRDPLRGADGNSLLSAEVLTTRDGDDVHTEITVTNRGEHPYFTTVDELGIRLPLQDRYDDPEECITHRCHVHLFCGGTSSYALALRMGGESPHLGLVLTEGSLVSYSIERDETLGSNDRGCFLLHPAPAELQPGQSFRIAWTMFPCEGRADFAVQAGRRARFVTADWDRYVLFAGEESTLTASPSFDPHEVTVNGSPAKRAEDGTFTAPFWATEPGEHELVVRADDRTVRTRVLVKDPLDRLLERRCTFLASKQQYDGEVKALRGAFLVYDNDEGHPYYHRDNDYNGGRERVGMGVLLADYLTAVRDGVVASPAPDDLVLIRASLDAYVDYVRRELVDVASGEVCNDIGRDASFHRLYNAPWFATLFLSLNRLDPRREHVLAAHRIVRRYYADGGMDFYPIELPVAALCEALEAAGLQDELTAVREEFVGHARRIAVRGVKYPASEVNFEQSIVAPAADILLQAHLVTGDPAMLAAGREQMRILDQFQGMQPDHHLNEVAIRHWDGYWFGKNRLFGDTFPHYWSALTGNVFATYAAITGDREYARRAEKARRAVLSLIFDDGTASCAFVHPLRVNGRRARSFDPYANDQDWAMVFALRQLRSGAVV